MIHFIVDGIKRRFHRDMVMNPVTHGWVLNLYRAGERYPERVCDYFQAEYAPCPILAKNLKRHASDEAKHGVLFAHAITSLEQPVLELPVDDIFNEVIRSFTPETFHVTDADPPDDRRRKLANFMAHAHFLEKRIARSFSFHTDACDALKRERVAQIVAKVREDEAHHVGYTREAVYNLLTRHEADEVFSVHRRAEAKANLLFSQRQVKICLQRFGPQMRADRRLFYPICAALMEGAGQLV
jgi:hypothetical protein